MVEEEKRTWQSKQVNQDKAGLLSGNYNSLQKFLIFFKFIVLSTMIAMVNYFPLMKIKFLPLQQIYQKLTRRFSHSFHIRVISGKQIKLPKIPWIRSFSPVLRVNFLGIDVMLKLIYPTPVGIANYTNNKTDLDFEAFIICIEGKSMFFK